MLLGYSDLGSLADANYVSLSSKIKPDVFYNCVEPRGRYD